MKVIEPRSLHHITTPIRISCAQKVYGITSAGVVRLVVTLSEAGLGLWVYEPTTADEKPEVRLSLNGEGMEFVHAWQTRGLVVPDIDRLHELAGRLVYYAGLARKISERPAQREAVIKAMREAIDNAMWEDQDAQVMSTAEWVDSDAVPGALWRTITFNTTDAQLREIAEAVELSAKAELVFLSDDPFRYASEERNLCGKGSR